MRAAEEHALQALWLSEWMTAVAGTRGVGLPRVALQFDGSITTFWSQVLAAHQLVVAACCPLAPAAHCCYLSLSVDAGLPAVPHAVWSTGAVGGTAMASRHARAGAVAAASAARRPRSAASAASRAAAAARASSFSRAARAASYLCAHAGARWSSKWPGRLEPCQPRHRPPQPPSAAPTSAASARAAASSTSAWRRPRSALRADEECALPAFPGPCWAAPAHLHVRLAGDALCRRCPLFCCCPHAAHQLQLIQLQRRHARLHHRRLCDPRGDLGGTQAADGCLRAVVQEAGWETATPSSAPPTWSAGACAAAGCRLPGAIAAGAAAVGVGVRAAASCCSTDAHSPLTWASARRGANGSSERNCAGVKRRKGG